MSAVRFDTRTVPPGQRSRFWRNVVHDLFQLESESTALGNESLEASVEKHDFGNLSMFTLRGGSQQVRVHDGTHRDAAYIIFPHTPDGTIEVGGVRRLLLPGCAYLVEASVPMLIRTLRRFEHLTLSVPLSSLERSASLAGRRPGGPVVLSGAVTTTLAVTLRTLFVNAQALAADAAPRVARSMVELVNAALLESRGHDAEASPGLDAHHRQRIRQYALARLSDPGLCVESIASAVALSPRRVHQLFADSDMTLMRWIWSERLTQCHNQLVGGSSRAARIGDVAYEWGFSDPAHFSRAFRQRYGVAPSQLLRKGARTDLAPVTGDAA